MHAAAVARTEHAVAVQQQRGDADEFRDFDQRGFVLFVAIVLRRGRGQLGEVGQRFAALFRQRRIGARGETEATEEAAAPVEQAATAIREAGIIVREQQVEREVARVQLFDGMLAQAWTSIQQQVDLLWSGALAIGSTVAVAVDVGV